MGLGIGSGELIILFVIALLLFGKNLPDVAKTLGKGMMEFKKGLYDIQGEIMSAGSSRPSSSSSGAPQSRPIPADAREEAIAPKFEPPKFEPTEVTPEQPA